MMSSDKNTPILVVPATSKVAASVVKELQKRNVKVRVLLRSAERAKALFGEEVEIFDGFDYDNSETATAALSGVEKLFLGSTLVPHWVEQTKSLIDAVKKENVKHIVRLSVFSASDTTKGFGASIPGKKHREVEQYIESNGFIYTFLRPTWFYQNIESLNGREIRQKSILSSPLGSDSKLSYIDVRDLAKVAALALTESGHKNKIYELTGSELVSMREITDILSRITGRTIRLVDLKYEESAKWMVEELGFEEKYAEGVAYMCNQGRLGNTAVLTEDLEKVTGYKGITFEQYVEDNLQSFMPTTA